MVLVDSQVEIYQLEIYLVQFFSHTIFRVQINGFGRLQSRQDHTGLFEMLYTLCILLRFEICMSYLYESLRGLVIELTLEQSLQIESLLEAETSIFTLIDLLLGLSQQQILLFKLVD